MNRSKKCEKFLRINEVNCCSIIGENTEPSFNRNGCECCESGYQLDTYPCNGFNPKTKKVVELGEVCHDCICYFYNGDDSQIHFNK